MKQNRKKYDTAFKLEAIRLATEGDHNISEVERNLYISKGTLARWIREKRQIQLRPSPVKVISKPGMKKSKG